MVTRPHHVLIQHPHYYATDPLSHVCICYMFQSEKAKMLMDNEVLKLQELDGQYESELRDWKQNLRFRKQV